MAYLLDVFVDAARCSKVCLAGRWAGTTLWKWSSERVVWKSDVEWLTILKRGGLASSTD